MKVFLACYSLSEFDVLDAQGSKYIYTTARYLAHSPKLLEKFGSKSTVDYMVLVTDADETFREKIDLLPNSVAVLRREDTPEYKGRRNYILLGKPFPPWINTVTYTDGLVFPKEELEGVKAISKTLQKSGTPILMLGGSVNKAKDASANGLISSTWLQGRAVSSIFHFANGKMSKIPLDKKLDILTLKPEVELLGLDFSMLLQEDKYTTNTWNASQFVKLQKHEENQETQIQVTPTYGDRVCNDCLMKDKCSEYKKDAQCAILAKADMSLGLEHSVQTIMGLSARRTVEAMLKEAERNLPPTPDTTKAIAEFFKSVTDLSKAGNDAKKSGRDVTLIVGSADVIEKVFKGMAPLKGSIDE